MALTIPTKPRYHEDAKPAKQYDYDRPESKRGVMAVKLPHENYNALEDQYMLSETPQTAEMRAMLDQPSGALTYNPFMGMSDQEIRARALECACRLFAGHMFKSGGSDAFDGCLAEFEAYIRNGRATP